MLNINIKNEATTIKYNKFDVLYFSWNFLKILLLKFFLCFWLSNIYFQKSLFDI